ncbi:MAG TPA: GTP pyrophosphokinase [Candidatus Dormibacteraeota bacterium]|nr:GTP pyrophosphokinase [Candidatus Dormibacteraeota bacterium]
MNPPIQQSTLPALARALEIAVSAHKGQKDRYGAPYVLHPMRVMARVETPDEKIVAILHDVVEDSKDWTFDRLKAEGFSTEIVAALDCVTKREGEEYEDFVKRSAYNPLARRVKLADLEDNMDLRRLPELSEKDLERLKKYHRAWHFLTKSEA